MDFLFFFFFFFLSWSEKVQCRTNYLFEIKLYVWKSFFIVVPYAMPSRTTGKYKSKQKWLYKINNRTWNSNFVPGQPKKVFVSFAKKNHSR